MITYPLNMLCVMLAEFNSTQNNAKGFFWLWIL